MPYSDRFLLVDKGGMPIPQFFDNTLDAFQALSGRNGAIFVESKGRHDVIRAAPVVGAKTVTTTAAEIFAGSSRLANRYAMIVYNEGSQTVYWGGPGVTVTNGFPLLPQDMVVFDFDPTVAVPIYMVAASNVPVRVVELA